MGWGSPRDCRGRLSRLGSVALCSRSGAYRARLVVMLVEGGGCVTDLEALRGQERLFGTVASETTAHRGS